MKVKKLKMFNFYWFKLKKANIDQSLKLSLAKKQRDGENDKVASNKYQVFWKQKNVDLVRNNNPFGFNYFFCYSKIKKQKKRANIGRDAKICPISISYKRSYI